MKTCAAVFAMVLASVGWADYYTGGDNTTDAFSNASLWSGGVAPSAEGGSSIDYLLARNRYIKTPIAGSDMTFHGMSLTLGEVGGASGSVVFQAVKGEETNTFENDGLSLANGWMTTWNDGNPYPTIAGKVTVLSPDANPYLIQLNKRNTRFTFTGKVVAAQGKAIKIYPNNDAAKLMSVRFAGDMSEYLGTILVSDATILIDNSFAGTLMFEKSSQVGAAITDQTTVQNLSILADTTLVVPSDGVMGGTRQCAHLTVLGTASASAPVKVTLSKWPTGWSQNMGGITDYPFLTVPTSSTLKADDFVATWSESAFEYTTFCVTETDNGNGTKNFNVHRRGYVQEENGAAEWKDQSAGLFGYQHSMGDDTNIVYFAKASVSRTYVTPASATAELAAHSFVLHAEEGKAMNLKIATLDCLIADLRVQASDSVFAADVYQNSPSATLRGGLWLAYGKTGTDVKALFPVGGDYYKSFVVASSIKGDADAKMNGQAGTPRTLTFSGDNSAWTGGMELVSGEAGSATFAITRKEALGGPLSAFRADALTIGENGIFGVTDDVTLDEPTRGVTVAAATAVVTVPEEKTLTLGETVTYADGAKLTKKGAGTLALGGTAVVADGASASLDVSEGFVKPLAAGALAGVTLSCGANGKFLYDVPAADATGIGATGLVDPVLAEGSAFRFSVALDARPQGTLSVPVCTLAADKVAAFKAAFKFVRTTPNTGCRLVEKSAGEGRVTLVAEVYPSGLLMIVR